jgi:ABC-type transport system involved in cytochrome bd biosynthesis fused ATPase/permease subunit|nr:ABC transporter ATP-binding protein/permease [Ruminococcus sp. AF42-10]
MMINKRLIGTVAESKKYIAGNVASQWVSLCSNVVIMGSIANFIGGLAYDKPQTSDIIFLMITIAICVAIRFVCTKISSKMSFLSSKSVKQKLRKMIFEKVLRLGASYNEKVMTSEIVQISVEGVEQLETYFGAYLPQFFYAMIAPLTLFVVTCFVNVLSAVVLLVCVPLIPIAIALVQTWAKKLLSKYWGQYTALGDTFLENLQGLTTLKIYKSDKFKNDEMNIEAEKFRKITMKVLTMQLNSITIMDLIAYGGAAVGMILAVTQFACGNIDVSGCLFIILLSADFFIPMRQLGSFFHIAMNGMAASDKIFNLLDIDESSPATKEITDNIDIECKSLCFSYDESREILHNVNVNFKQGSFTAIVGKSGCGKSTVASILTGKNKGFKGSVTIGNIPINEISESSLMKSITYIGHNSYIFKGTVRENLLMANDVDDNKLWQTLEKVNLADFLKSENGLDTVIDEKASNISGGQRQRLALARALLHNSRIYIFDEATSNIDVESENDIMAQIAEIAKSKTVILISHRLANVVDADNIYVMQDGNTVESGTHTELLKNNGVYAKLYNSQIQLENYTKEV